MPIALAADGAEPRRPRLLDRGPLPPDAADFRRRPRRSSRVLATSSPAATSSADVGRERDAVRSRRRLLSSSATSWPASPCSTTIATAAAYASGPTSPASSPTGSDARAHSLPPSPLACARPGPLCVADGPAPHAGGGQRHDPRPRRAATAAAGSGAPPERRRRRHARGRTTPTGPAPQRRLSRDGAARGVRSARRAAREARSAQRGVRAARARDRRGHDGRLPEQRPHLPQRLLALADEAVRPRALRRRAARSRSGSIGPASCACSATSTRT